MEHDKTIFIASQKKVSLDDPKAEEIYKVGTLAKINQQIVRLPNGTVRVHVEGIHRAEIVRFVDTEDNFTVEVKKIADVKGDAFEEEAFKRSLLKQFGQYIKISRKITKEKIGRAHV